MTGNQDGAKGGKGGASGALGDHGSFAEGRLWGTSPAEGLPMGDALLHAVQGGALLPAPLLQSPVCSSWWKGG